MTETFSFGAWNRQRRRSLDLGSSQVFSGSVNHGSHTIWVDVYRFVRRKIGRRSGHTTDMESSSMRYNQNIAVGGVTSTYGRAPLVSCTS